MSRRFVLLLLLSACKPDLTHPFVGLHKEDGLCGRQVIVDEKNQLWTEHGCEGSSGFWPGRSISRDERSRLNAAFDALPVPPTPCGSGADGGTSGSSISLTRRDAAAETSWTACQQGTEVVPPFDTPTNLLTELADR